MRKLSRTTGVAFLALALLGLIHGFIMFTHRPASYPPNDPANNAIALHIGLAIGAVIVVTGIQIYRSRRHLSNIWLAPFSQSAMARLRATFMPKHFSIISLARMLLCVLPLFLIVWTPYRAALQIIAAFDPSVTSNAWGGPTYLGATAAHYLDGLILMYIGALLLHWFMVKQRP
jgi:hypothetical protein